MRTENYLPAVREQYEDYPFPNVDPEVERRFLQMMPQDCLANIVHHCFRGQRTIDQNFRVLVAGGGTGHASTFLAEQLRHYGARVTYIDLSSASSRVAKRRAAIRGLDNIDWHSGSLLDLPTMELGQFDYINCTGVLHHLADPTEGLKALKAVLKPDGALGLMVYGQYGRQSYYHVQKLMRLLRECEDSPEERIAMCQKAMLELPETFFLGHGIHRENHLKGFFGDPINLFDTFLHSQDRAYTVDEVYDWIESVGLEFGGFTNFNPSLDEKYKYQADLIIKDEALYQRVATFDKRRREAVAEMVCSNIGLHTFYASFQSDSVARYDNLNMIPFFNEMYCGGQSVYSEVSRLHIADALDRNPGMKLDLQHNNKMFTHLPSSREMAMLFRLIDGRKTLAQIVGLATSALNSKGIESDRLKVMEAYRVLAERCEPIDWLRVRHKSMQAYPTYSQMQGRLQDSRCSSTAA